MRVPLLILALALIPFAQAQSPPSNAIDIVVNVPADGEPTQAGPQGILAFVNATPGERVEWRVETVREHVSIELRIEGARFDVSRPEQIVPRLALDAGEARCIDVRAKGACDDDLFAVFSNDRVWEAEAIARVYHRTGTLDRLVLRLNIPGPANGTLALARDVTPPVVTAGEPRDFTTYGFYLETRTNEQAIVDVQIRKEGSQEWIPNPTPDLNLFQRFPIQGFSPNESADYRIIAHDWAMNVATLGPFHVRSAPAPVVPIPVVTAVSPAPNATVEPGALVVVRATVESPGSAIDASSLQLFFDKTPVTEGIAFDGANLSYTPTTILAAGHHSVAVEVLNALGGKGVARWSFQVGDPQGAPGAPVALLLVGAAAVSLLVRRR